MRLSPGACGAGASLFGLAVAIVLRLLDVPNEI